ncbi:LacI family DNA-binding transcriptional regulator [Paenibacillus phyllosphaerae]|nr:LacI family DNA-binding transcriptional regulator [Paenibacillus phyllosphaerae]
MKATIYDIAREAGVSIATVSKVINGKGKISEERRREVMAIMERLQYQPSVIASALTGKHTYTIGLLLPDLSNPFFAEVARAVEDRGHQLGYSVVMCSTDNKDERIERYLSLLKQQRVDGIILATGIGSAEQLKKLNHAMPVVVIGREVPESNLPTVVADDWGGGKAAAEHLLALGHRRMAVFAERLSITSSRERLRGFRQAIEEAGFTLTDEAIVICDDRIDDGRRQASALLRGSDRPTAVFCFNDLLAVGVLQAAKEAGLSVPAQLSIVSFDNTILAEVTDPPLTAVAQPMTHIGASAVDLLLEEIGSKPKIKARIALPTELVIRRSTGRIVE